MSHLSNPNISEENEDALYHLGLTYRPADPFLKTAFGDVKFVCMGGSNDRAKRFAYRAARELDMMPPFHQTLRAIGKTERFVMYKVGPVLSVSHGMGIPSVSILLHEVAKLLHHAEATGYTFIRTGTCGGVGVAPGTVVVSDKCYNDKLEAVDEVWSLGKCIKRDATLDEAVGQELLLHAAGPHVATPVVETEVERREARRVKEGLDYASGEAHHFSRDDGREIVATLGSTLSCCGFYEQQGRTDGALAAHTEADKMAWLHELRELGIVNIEMEGVKVAAVCRALAIPAAVICTVVVNRLLGDQVVLKPHQLATIASNAQRLALRFIKARLEARA